jgi:hypothetical protein
MRIYPQKKRAMAAAAPSGQINLEHEVPEGTPEPREPRTPIVSVHGHDLNDS